MTHIISFAKVLFFLCTYKNAGDIILILLDKVNIFLKKKQKYLVI